MKMKKLLLLPALLLTLSVGNVACSYHNDDNPNEYPDPQPEPEPEPEPGPDINQKYLEAAYTSNCFMVKPGQSVDIPILKAFAMWNLYAEWLGETDLMGLTPEPVLLCSNRHPHRRCNPLELACLGDTLRSGCGIGSLRQNLHMGQ